MIDVATHKMTFEEFVHLPEGDIAYELVNGKLVPLMAPDFYHGRTQVWLGHHIAGYLGDHFGGFFGSELDFPTIPYHGRRGDLVYYAAGRLNEDDWARGYSFKAPDLVIEVVSPSPGDQRRDRGDKPLEYAQVGIPHYWLVDPTACTVEMLVLGQEGRYERGALLELGDDLTSPLFPGLRVPLRRIFCAPAGPRLHRSE